MAVYKNKEELMNTDWQAKINEATAAGDMKAAAQYEQARNDKINSSDYTGKQTTTNNYSQYLGSSGSGGGTSSNNPYGYTPKDGTGVYGMLTNNSTVKNYTQNGVTYQTGADMRRNPAYAGQAVASNGYTVFYDDNGYAKMAVKGVADYTPWTDSNVTNGTYGTGGAWTDSNMLTGDELKQIADIRAAMQRGEMTGDQANAAANQIRSRYGYTIDKYGNVTDLLGKSTVDERRQNWGLPENISNEQQSFLQQMYPDGNSLLDALYSLQTSGTANGAPTWSGSEWDSILEELGQQLLNMNYTDWTQGEQYQALADRYGQQGRMSMQDVLGQISSRTGGLASSYATTAAQQQYNQLMSQLEEAAMDMYNVERSDLYDRANMARQYAQDDYNRYLDEWDQWNTNRNYEYQLSRDAIEDQRYADNLAYEREQAEQQTVVEKPNLTAAQTLTAIKNGVINDTTLRAYEYYFGEPYGGNTAIGTGTDTPKKKGGGYDNGSLSTSEVKRMQEDINKYLPEGEKIAVDGKWGAATKKAADGLTADEYAKEYYRQHSWSGRSDR